MDQTVKAAIFEAVKKEPFARALQMELVDLEDGYSLVHMIYES
jgi:acyl-coenzyme A thioesterase PaaI-like protein